MQYTQQQCINITVRLSTNLWHRSSPDGVRCWMSLTELWFIGDTQYGRNRLYLQRHHLLAVGILILEGNMCNDNILIWNEVQLESDIIPWQHLIPNEACTWTSYSNSMWSRMEYANCQRHHSLTESYTKSTVEINCGNWQWAIDSIWHRVKHANWKWYHLITV